MWDSFKKYLMSSTPMSLFLRDNINVISQNQWIEQGKLGARVAGFMPERMEVKEDNIKSFKERIEPAIEALRAYQNQGVDYIRSALNKAGIGFKKVLSGDGVITHEIEADGITRPAYSLGVTSKVADRGTLTKETAFISPAVRHKKEEMNMAEALMRKKVLDPSYSENSILGDIIQPLSRDGFVSEGFENGWNAILDTVSSLPVPDRYDSTEFSMGYTVRNGMSFMGVSAGTVSSDPQKTLRHLYETARNLNLSIPKRPDGTEVAMNNLDHVAEKCLIGTVRSPFVVGGNSTMAEGSEMLVNDRNLVRAAKVHKNLDVISIDANIQKYKDERKYALEAMMLNNENKDYNAINQRKMDALNTPNMQSYDRYISSFADMTQLRKQQESMAVSAKEIDRDEDVGFGFEDIIREDITHYDKISYEEAKKLGFIASPSNTSFERENDGSLNAVSCINPSDMKDMNISLDNPMVQGYIPPFDLEDGDYSSKDGETIQMKSGYASVLNDKVVNLFSDVENKPEFVPDTKPEPTPSMPSPNSNLRMFA